MKPEDALLVCFIVSIVLLSCNVYLLVNYLYHKKVIDKVRKLCIRDLVSPEAIIECCEPIRGKEECGSISRRDGYSCNRKKGHEGIHIATDFFKILSIWEESESVHTVDIVPESGFEETQKISKKWFFSKEGKE